MNGRKTRKQQITIMSIIAVAIVTLSIGFAAFSTTLRISSTAAVNPDSGNFSVVFSSNAETLETNDITASPSTYGDPAEIENGAVPTISGLNAKFTNPGQTVTYTFYALNEGAYLAYLNYINFNNVEGESKNIKCEAGEGTSADLVAQACNGISISVKVGSDEAVSTNQSGISNHTLTAGASETVVVTISYNTGSTLADGPFNVTFGDIELIYSTIADYVPPTQLAKVCHAVSGDGTQGGDEIACGDEHFYVVTNDGTNIEMITKYALNVGEYPYPGETLGIQSEKTLECRGEINDYGCTLSDYLTYANYGMTYFADDLYYGELEPLVEVVIFDSKYSENPYAENAYVYDENSNVYEYVENYETYLKTELGVTSASGALANLTQRSTLESLDLPAFPLYMTGVAEGSQTCILTNVFETGMGTTVERVHYSSGPSGQAHVRPIITMLVSELG